MVIIITASHDQIFVTHHAEESGIKSYMTIG